MCVPKCTQCLTLPCSCPCSSPFSPPPLESQCPANPVPSALDRAKATATAPFAPTLNQLWLQGGGTGLAGGAQCLAGTWVACHAPAPCCRRQHKGRWLHALACVPFARAWGNL